MGNLVRSWNLQRSRWWSGLRADWSAKEQWGSAKWWRNHQRKCIVCHAELSVNTSISVNTTLHCDLSRETLEPHAHVLRMWETLTSTDTTNKEHHARKITCAGTRHCVRVWCPVYSGELGQILDVDVDKLSWPPHNLLFDSWVRLVLNC